RITTAGAVTEFPTPTAGSDPINIAAGPDGNLWFTETNVNKIGRITTGPDGNLWYTTGFTGTIGRITPSGVATEFTLAAFGGTFIVTGPDGNLWITGNNNNILRFSVTATGPVSTTTGVVSSINPSTVGQSVTF